MSGLISTKTYLLFESICSFRLKPMYAKLAWPLVVSHAACILQASVPLQAMPMTERVRPNYYWPWEMFLYLCLQYYQTIYPSRGPCDLDTQYRYFVVLNPVRLIKGCWGRCCSSSLGGSISSGEWDIFWKQENDNRKIWSFVTVYNQEADYWNSPAFRHHLWLCIHSHLAIPELVISDYLLLRTTLYVFGISQQI